MHCALGNCQINHKETICLSARAAYIAVMCIARYCYRNDVKHVNRNCKADECNIFKKAVLSQGNRAMLQLLFWV